MRILVLTPTFLPVVGGAELLVLEVCRRLAARHEVRLLTPVLPADLVKEQGSREYDALVNFPVEHYRDAVSFMRVPGHGASLGAIPPFSLSAVSAVLSGARRFKPDVVHVHYLMPTGLAAVVAERWLGVPVVVSMTGRDTPGPGVPILWRRWQRFLLERVSDATYVSEYCRSALWGRGREQGHVIHAGVEMPPPRGDGEARRKTLDIPGGECMIFALQRLGREKRTDVLLHGLKRCRERCGRGMLVIGGQGSEEGALRRLADRLGLSAHVRFAGYIPRHELPSYFDACDIFAFHSLFETFGIVVAQAMSYGKPVVTARNTALPEVLGDGGLLADTGDGKGFGDAMAGLAADPEKRRRFGEAGRARAEACFNWDTIAGQYEAVLARAASERRHAA
jgi:phosphatidylinositol alpha-1,6-mannosyltransferase